MRPATLETYAQVERPTEKVPGAMTGCNGRLRIRPRLVFSKSWVSRGFSRPDGAWYQRLRRTSKPIAEQPNSRNPEGSGITATSKEDKVMVRELLATTSPIVKVSKLKPAAFVWV